MYSYICTHNFQQIHVGYGVYLEKEKYYAISSRAVSSGSKSRNKGSLFTKDITVAVFGTKALQESTVSGCESNRTKSKTKKVNADGTDSPTQITTKALDATKVLAIKGMMKQYFVLISSIRRPTICYTVKERTNYC